MIRVSRIIQASNNLPRSDMQHFSEAPDVG